MKVFLDDLRPTPEGWVRTFTVEQTIDLVATYEVTHVSLDHDLGDADLARSEGRSEVTGYDVLTWIEEQVVCNKFKPPHMQVHSDNGPGIERMRRAIASIERHVNRNEAQP